MDTGTSYKYGINPGEGANTGGKRKKLTLSTVAPEVPSEVEVNQHMRDLEKKMGKKVKKAPLPKARSEYYPGSEETTLA